MTGARVTFVGHATVLLEQDGVKLLTDPVLRDRVGPLVRRRLLRGAASVEIAAGPPDAVLISHLHRDHLDLPSLRLLGLDVPLIVPTGVGTFVRRLGFRNVTELTLGDSIDVGGLTVSAVPAVHDGRRGPLGPPATCLGYLISGTVRTYFAGDTALFAAMAEIAPDLDLALLPVWGWGPNVGSGHLDPREAARALQLLQPKVAIPIHWGTFHPICLGRRMSRILSEPPREYARYAADLAPEVEVRILAPGESTSL